MTAGALQRLGGTARLVVPAGARGAIVREPPERVLAPVGFDEVLYRVDPQGAGAAAEVDEAAEGPGRLVLRSEQSGRVSTARSGRGSLLRGTLLEEGDAVCLVEVMKTFSTLPYRAAAGLPPARGSCAGSPRTGPTSRRGRDPRARAC